MARWTCRYCGERLDGAFDHMMLHIRKQDPEYPDLSFQPGTRRHIPGFGWIIDDAGTITPEMVQELKKHMQESEDDE